MTDDKSKIKKLCGLVNVEQLPVTVPPISVKQNKHRERVQVYRNVDCYVVCSHTGCKEMTDSLLVIKSCLTLAIQYPSATVKLNRLT